MQTLPTTTNITYSRICWQGRSVALSAHPFPATLPTPGRGRCGRPLSRTREAPERQTARRFFAVTARSALQARSEAPPRFRGKRGAPRPCGPWCRGRRRAQQPPARRRGHCHRERRASRMLVTEDGVAPADMGFLPVTGANRARHDVILTGTHGPVMGDESDAQSSLCVCDTVTATCKTAGRTT